MQDCPPLTFTDDVLAPAEAQCGASLLAFVLPMVVIVVLRWLACFVIWRSWLKRYRPSRSRLPIFPLISSVSPLCIAAIFVLGATQSADYHVVNFLLGITSAAFFLISFMTLRFYIRLSKRLVRFVDDDTASKAGTVDWLLKLLFRVSELLGLSLLVSAFLSLFDFAYAVPWFRVMIGLIAAGGVVGTNSLAYQQYRILRLAISARSLLDVSARSPIGSSKSTPIDAATTTDGATTD